MVAKMAMRMRRVILVVMESTGVYLAQIVHEKAHVQKIQKYTDSRYRTEGENDFQSQCKPWTIGFKSIDRCGSSFFIKIICVQNVTPEFTKVQFMRKV